jgi:hypothetical protein
VVRPDADPDDVELAKATAAWAHAYHVGANGRAARATEVWLTRKHFI